MTGPSRAPSGFAAESLPASAVQVVEWRPEWATAFAAERDRLRGVFADVPARIEHVGSTAVPGLPAKPIIDVLVGVARLSDVEERIPDLEGLGYAYVPEYEVQIPDRRYFRRPHHHPRTVHVHCVVEGGDGWTRTLRFRDLLRADPELRDEYAELKRRLAIEHRFDRAAYTDAKTPFIDAALDRPGGAS